MDEETTAKLQRMLAEMEIREALVRFCRGADRRDNDLIRSAFHPDAHDDHGAYSGDVEGFIAWQEERHRTIPQCMHLLGNSSIEIRGNHAFTETYCHATVSEPDGEGFTQTQILCRYIDVFERRETGWKILRRRVRYDSVTRSAISALVPAGLEAGVRTPADASYDRTL